jgi:integrase
MTKSTSWSCRSKGISDFRDAGINGLRLHDLRHTFASHAVMQGEGLLMAGKLLGHRYAHLEGRFLLDAAERIGEEIMRRSLLS